MDRFRQLLVVCSCTFALPAQDLLWQKEGHGTRIGRGREIHRLGDINGDGWEDLIEWGELGAPTSPWLRRNAIFVTSGRDGSVLSWSPPFENWSLTFRSFSLSPVGDMDHDGLADYAVTVYQSGSFTYPQHVQVRSSVTHVPIWKARIPNAANLWYGLSLAGDMDLDGDGGDDLVVAASKATPGGTLLVYDHFGNERYRIVDPLINVLVGTDVAALGGDLDGDGCDDFLAAGPDWQGRGAVVVFSGLTGAVLRVSYGDLPGDKLSFATGCGDMDHDGVLDYAGGGFWGASVVTAFSGATGLKIHTWRDSTWPYMGTNVYGGFDLDQDGVNDLVAGSYGNATHAMSGRDGTFFWTFPESAPASSIGEAQTLIAPPPGETYPVMVFGEGTWQSWTNPGTIMPPGKVRAYRGGPRGVRTYGQPDAAPGFIMPRIGMRDLPGQAVRITLSDAPAATPSLLLLGLSDTGYGALSLPAPLDPFGLPGMTLLTSAEVAAFTWTGASGMASGYAKFEFNLPPGRSLGPTGLPMFAQWLWFDPANLAIGGSTAGQRFFVQ